MHQLDLEAQYEALPFIDVDPYRRQVDYFSIRPTGNYGMDNVLGGAIALMLVKDLQVTNDPSTFSDVLTAFAENYNRDYKGIAVGLFEGLAGLLLNSEGVNP